MGYSPIERLNVRIVITSLVTAVTSFAATLAAVFAYLTTILREPTSVDAVFLALLLGYGVAARGFLCAAVAGAVLAVVVGDKRRSIRCLAFFLAMGSTGSVLGLWAAHASPHVSTSSATLLFATSWSAAGLVAALTTAWSPSAALRRTPTVPR